MRRWETEHRRAGPRESDSQSLGLDELGLDETLDSFDETESVMDAVTVGVDDVDALMHVDLPQDEGGFLVDDAPADELIAFDTIALHDEGWIDRGEPDSPEAADDMIEIPNLEPMAEDDGGEIGLDDLGASLELTSLPPLDAEPIPDEADDLNGEPFGEDIGALLSRVARQTASARGQLSRHTDAGEATIRFARLEDSVLARIRAPRAAQSNGWHTRYETADGVAMSLVDIEVTSVVLDGPFDAAEVQRCVVGTRDKGVFYSIDGAHTWQAATGLGEAKSAWVSQDGRQDDLIWARDPDGALFSSSDWGRTFTRLGLPSSVRSICPLSKEGILTCCGDSGQPAQITRSVDGGERWSACLGPRFVQLDEGDVFMTREGRHMVITHDVDPAGPWVSRDDGQTWIRLPGIPPAGPSLLLKDEVGTVLYCVHQNADDAGPYVMRHRLDQDDAGIVASAADLRRSLTEAGGEESASFPKIQALRGEIMTDKAVFFLEMSNWVCRIEIELEKAA